MGDEIGELRQLIDALKAMSDRVPDNDKQTINAAIKHVNHLYWLKDDLSVLRRELARIDEEYDDDVQNFPNDLDRTELATVTLAVVSVSRFLLQRAPSVSIDLLKAALLQLVDGGPAAAMFLPQTSTGRPPDVRAIQSIKGALAGLMHVQQVGGMSREQAAAWIAENISRELASRISGKPITARVVEEWLDRYGGSRPPDNVGGRSFKIWSAPLAEPLTKKRFRDMTRKIAKEFPARAGTQGSKGRW